MTGAQCKEALRLLGYKGETADEATLRLIEASFAEIVHTAVPACAVETVEMRVLENEVILPGEWVVKSRALAKHVRDCKEGILFAATLGAQVDRLLMRSAVSDIAKAAVLQACAAVILEEYADETQKNLRDMSFMTDRFSPGYGDWNLKDQEKLLTALNAQKRIGLTCTEHYMLTPTKSITALIGLSEKTVRHCENKCALCTSSTCPYRRKSQ